MITPCMVLVINKVIEWKCHFICLGKNTENEDFIFKANIMNNSKEERILGVTINELTFSRDTIELC